MKEGGRREMPCCQALSCTATSTVISPSTPFPNVISSSILHSSYTKLSANPTSILIPSVTSPVHRVPCLPPFVPNLTQFQSLFSKHLLKFQYELSSLVDCAPASLLLFRFFSHLVFLVQGQLFILPLPLHSYFHLVSSCLHVLSPSGTLADGHSLPTSTLLITHTSFPFFLSLFSCQSVLMIGLSLSFQVFKNYLANPYLSQISALLLLLF